MEIHGPFITRNPFTTAEEAVNAVVLMHEDGGAEQISLSAVARYLGITRSSVHQAHGSLAAFYVSLIDRFCYRWYDWLTSGYLDPTPIRLPEYPIECLGVLTWSSLRAVAAAEARAGRPEAWERVRRIDGRERRFIAEQIRAAAGRSALECELISLMALGAAVRIRMCEPVEPLDLSAARAAVLDWWTVRLGLPARADDGAT